MEIDKFEPGQRCYAFRGHELKEWIVEQGHGAIHLRCDDGIFFTAEAYEAEWQAIDARRKVILKEMLAAQDALLSAEFQIRTLQQRLTENKSVKTVMLKNA